MTPRIIKVREVPRESQRLPDHMHPVIDRILRARGVSDVSGLSLEIQSMLPPSKLGGVESAAALLADAVMQSQNILIVGDFDADGATGTTLAMICLRAMGCRSVDFRVPNRFEFGSELPLCFPFLRFARVQLQHYRFSCYV